jgi:hypothetical protein
LEERRTHPGFLSDGEAARDRKRTEEFVKSIINSEQEHYRSSNRLCDSCGTPVQNDQWECQKCNVNFCYTCGKDFGAMQKKMFPECPVCGIKLEAAKNIQLMQDKQKILRYISSTKVSEIRNREELCQRLARVFQKDDSYVKNIWFSLEKEHPILTRQISEKFKDQLSNQKSDHPRLGNRGRKNVMTKKTEEHTYSFADTIPDTIKPENDEKKENLRIKDMKPIDGFESEWKQGKMRPVDQKTYRSTFQDKD